jgi:hypothetical protein
MARYAGDSNRRTAEDLSTRLAYQAYLGLVCRFEAKLLTCNGRRSTLAPDQHSPIQASNGLHSSPRSKALSLKLIQKAQIEVIFVDSMEKPSES